MRKTGKAMRKTMLEQKHKHKNTTIFSALTFFITELLNAGYIVFIKPFCNKSFYKKSSKWVLGTILVGVGIEISSDLITRLFFDDEASILPVKYQTLRELREIKKTVIEIDKRTKRLEEIISEDKHKENLKKLRLEHELRMKELEQKLLQKQYEGQQIRKNMKDGSKLLDITKTWPEYRFIPDPTVPCSTTPHSTTPSPPPYPTPPPPKPKVVVARICIHGKVIERAFNSTEKFIDPKWKEYYNKLQEKRKRNKRPYNHHPFVKRKRVVRSRSRRRSFSLGRSVRIN
jgi:hypothetical protein